MSNPLDGLKQVAKSLGENTSKFLEGFTESDDYRILTDPEGIFIGCWKLTREKALKRKDKLMVAKCDAHINQLRNK